MKPASNVLWLFVALLALPALAENFINGKGDLKHPIEMIDPPAFDAGDKAGLAKFFKENGYVVVDRVSEKKDRDALVALMRKVAVSDVPDTRRLGFMDIYHDDTLAQLRQNPAMYEVFAAIFQEPKLWSVFDRVMYWGEDEGEKDLHPHVDQNPLHMPKFVNVQAMLALRDMHEGTGTLAIVPKSHLFFDQYIPWMPKPTSGFVEYYGEKPLPFVGVRLREGQIIIWDSRTTHSRFRGTPTGDRFAALITYTPAKDDPALAALRMKYFAEGTGHSDHEAGLRATAKPRCAVSLRNVAENLTPLGRRLYGVDSWFGGK